MICAKIKCVTCKEEFEHYTRYKVDKMQTCPNCKRLKANKTARDWARKQKSK